jgi:hypothetical protein
MIAVALLLASLASNGAVAAPPENETTAWRLRASGQLPVIAASHVVGGFGLGLDVEKGLFAIAAEAQVLPIDVCDSPCGLAYGAGVGLALQPRIGQAVDARVGVMLQRYAQPGLHQDLTAIGPRVGVRWQEQGGALSLDGEVAFASSGSFGANGFARNNVLPWGMPELILAFWF